MGFEDKNAEREEVQIYPKSKGNTSRQWIATLASSTGMWATGTVLGWSSPSNPDLEESGDIGQLSTSQLSWIASISLLAALTSCFLIGYTVEKIGRRLTSMLVVIPFVIGYIILAAAQNLGMVIAGRFITGFTAGAYTTCMVVCLCSGIAFIYVVGAIGSWRITSIVGGCVPIIHLIAMFFMPETPRYLLSKGENEKAAASLRWLRGAASTQEVELELKEIQFSIDETAKMSASEGGGSFWNASTLKPCLISVTAMAFQQLAGINAVLFFAVDIFQSSGSDINPNVCAIIVGTTQAVCFLFSGLLTDRFGRKTLFFISEVGMTISLVVLGVYYYLKENDPDKITNLGWLPLVSLILYMITYCVGVGPLPWTLMGDLCPPQIKGIASAMTTSCNWGLGFIVAFSFNYILEAIQGYGAFWIFAGICVFGAGFAAFILPETKGKTIEEVMQLFAGKNNKV